MTSKHNILKFILLGISTLGLLDILYAISNGNLWGNFLMIFWYWALFMPLVIFTHSYTEYQKPLFNIAGITGLFAIAVFTFNTIELAELDSATLLLFSAIYLSTFSYVYYYFKNSK